MSEGFGTWQLDSLVAVGGLGEVWRGRRGATVAAVKRLHTHLARNAEARRQFAVEQLLTTTLPRHPNVVHAIEADEVDGRPYVALDLIAGEDLRRIIAPPALGAAARRIAIPRSRAIAIVTAACDAAAHLHIAGWVHGDINPGNLVVAPAERSESAPLHSWAHPTGDRVVLVDLGVARAIGEAGAVRGTHAYMAPEQVRGEAWTRATDVFALGVVLWELIAGQRLFHRGPPWLSMAAVVEGPVPPLADPVIDELVQGALAKDPHDRTATAEELGDQLRATLD